MKKTLPFILASTLLLNSPSNGAINPTEPISISPQIEYEKPKPKKLKKQRSIVEDIFLFGEST